MRAKKYFRIKKRRAKYYQKILQLKNILKLRKDELKIIRKYWDGKLF